jgi:carboxylesterase
MSVAGQGDPSAFEEWHGEVGCLLLHGFPGSPAEMRELGVYLGRQGMSIVVPCLPGFGQQPEALQGRTWQDWLRAAASDLRRLQERCRWVFAAGLSMGAMLALYLAAEVPVAGVVAISPAVRLRNPLAPLIPLARYVVRWHEAGTDQDLVDPGAPQRQWYYTRVPGAAIGEMQRLLRAAWRVSPQVRVPVLLIQSRSDAVLRSEGAPALLQRLGTEDKRLLWLERSGHNVLVDAERERVFAETHGFIVAHIMTWKG